MLRRPPTTLTITAEDVADYEDRRNAEHAAYMQKINDAIARQSRLQHPEPQWPDSHRSMPSHTSFDSDSDDHYREQDDSVSGMGGFDGAGEGNSTMDLDASPLGAAGMGRGLGRGMVVRGGLGGDGGGGGFSSPAAARAVGRGGRGGRGGLGARGVGGAPAMQAVGRGQGQGQGAVGGAGPVVTPETRPTRSREERIGVAPERRRR